MSRLGIETSLQTLVVMRHGDYMSEKKYDYKDGPLLPDSVAKVTSTAYQLKEILTPQGFFEPGNSLIATSDRVRARETAEIVRLIFGLTCITLPQLGLDDRGHTPDGDKVLTALGNILLNGGGWKGLVIVTHEEQTEWLPRLLHPKVNSLQSPLYYGNAAVYDKTGAIVRIYPK